MNPFFVVITTIIVLQYEQLPCSCWKAWISGYVCYQNFKSLNFMSSKINLKMRMQNSCYFSILPVYVTSNIAATILLLKSGLGGARLACKLS